MAERLPLDDADLKGSLVATRGRSIDERLAVAFRLGDEDCLAYAELLGNSLDAASARLKAATQIGRIPLFNEPSMTS